MPRYFVEFVNTGKKETCVITIKLFHNTLPKITDAVSEQFYNSSKEKTDITYRKSKVTRVIAPEYLVQFGSPVRRNVPSKSKLIDTNDDVIKNEITISQGESYLKKIQGRRGLICLADKSGKSFEICIVFVPWGKYKELDNYIVVGECKEWKELSKWMGNVEILEETDSLKNVTYLEKPKNDSIWVNRCGRLKEKQIDKEETAKVSVKRGTNTTNVTKRKIKAVDLLFKKKKTN